MPSTLLRHPDRSPGCCLGRVVTLRPFDRPVHAQALYEATHGSEKDDLWRYMGDGPFASLDVFEAAFEQKQRSVDPVFFAIVDNATGLPVGQAAYMRIDPVNRVIEVGNIIFTPALQRSSRRDRGHVSHGAARLR